MAWNLIAHCSPLVVACMLPHSSQTQLYVVVTCTVEAYQCALDVAVPLGMHCLEVKLMHYAVEEVADGPETVDGGA